MTIGGEASGTIEIGLFGETVPQKIQNFAKLVQQGLAMRGRNSVKDFMIQV